MFEFEFESTSVEILNEFWTFVGTYLVRYLHQ